MKKPRNCSITTRKSFRSFEGGFVHLFFYEQNPKIFMMIERSFKVNRDFVRFERDFVCFERDFVCFLKA